jgi:hypothetical protein
MAIHEAPASELTGAGQPQGNAMIEHDRAR